MERTYELIRAVKHREIKEGRYYYEPAGDRLIFTSCVGTSKTTFNINQKEPFACIYADNELYEVEFKLKKK